MRQQIAGKSLPIPASNNTLPRSAKIAAILFLLPFASLLFAQPVLYYNGHIHTSDPSHPLATYFAIDNGLIVQVGDTITPEIARGFNSIIDLHGSAVIPGIIDSHIHFIDGGLGLLQTGFGGVHDTLALAERITATLSNLMDGIYVGRDLGYEPLASIPNPRAYLDRLLPGTPAVIFLKSGHGAIANSAGLALLGFTPGSKIGNGTIGTAPDGTLNGYLLEEAAMEANKAVSARCSTETIERAILRAQHLALSYGITTIGDNTFSPHFLKIYQEMQNAGLLPLRVRARSYGRIPSTDVLMSSLGQPKLGFIGGRNLERVRYHAIKYFEDMSLSTPEGSTGAAEPGGTVFLDRDQLRDIFLLHTSKTLAFHVQGKQGLENILQTAEQYGPRTDRRRHVIDHAGYASPAQLSRIRSLGLALTIIGSQTFDYPALVRHYRGKNASRFVETDLLNTRQKYALGGGALSSDFPYGMDTTFDRYPHIDGLNPFPMMAVNVSGRMPDGSPIEGFADKTLTSDEALASFTANGAYAVGDEHSAGRIAPGMRADFAILKDDPFQGDPMRLYDARVQETFIDGRSVYKDGAAMDTQSPLLSAAASDYALSPIIGYDPSLGLILGGAAFVYPLQTPGSYYDIQLQAILKGKYNISAAYTRYGLWEGADLTISGAYTNYFSYYFGEGDTTSAGRYSKIYADVYTLRTELSIHLNRELGIRLFGDLRGRRETQVTTSSDSTIAGRLFPDETTIAFGAAMAYDTRDNAASARKGLYALGTVSYTPGGLNVKGAGDVSQLSAELRAFQYIYNEDYVLAARLAGGTTFGTPGYLFRYTLGGGSMLRGYYSNRFRGKSFAAGQIETRVHIWRKFYGVLFADAGDIGDDGLKNLRHTVGLGLRIAISQNLRLRLDYGIAPDQNGVFFSFGEAF